MPTTADFAAAYVRRYGFSIVPLPPRAKRPSVDDWGRHCITTVSAARAYYDQHPDWNMGVALGPSRVCSFDVDDIDATRAIFEEFGWDLDAVRDGNPTIQGSPGGFRVMFRVPEGVELPYCALTWPRRDQPGSRFTVWELRAATDQQRQDVLPPSIHPDTGRPYVWLTAPNGHIPEPPDFLLQLWRNWSTLKDQCAAVCPWAPKPKPRAPRRPATAQGDGTSVIDAYDAAHDVEDALARYGYKRQGKRWLSPHSSTGLPGVTVLDGNRVWIHHASDPLCSVQSGQPVAPFDLLRQYEHGGDMRRAVRAAAEELGLHRTAVAAPRTAVAVARPAPIDPDTGEVLKPRPDAAPGLFAPLADKTKNGTPLATIENLQEICRRLGVTVRYNVITKDEELLVPEHSFSQDNRANASLAWLTSWCKRLRMPTGEIGDYVTFMADQNLHNPVANWVLSKPWDRQSRLRDLYETVTAVGESGNSRVRELKETFIRRWLISAVAAAFNPAGVSAHGVLVFQGEQYLGKTAWFKRLVPKDLGVVQDGMILRPDDRDSVKQVVSNWLVELGELDATFRKADIAQLKAFLTRDRDVLRRAYARRESEFARRTVFFASVNPREFLHDQTGNRRFWVVECDWIDYDHGVDMQQLWAEVYELYRAGEPWVLQTDEYGVMQEHNKAFEVVDPIEDLISTGLAWDDPPTLWRWRSATEILSDLGRDTPSREESTRTALIIRARNGNQSRRQNSKRLLLAPSVIAGRCH